jgi:phosphoglycerol transferase
MKGRESDWQSQLEDLPVPELVSDAIAVGYEGILIDRFGYADLGAQLEADLTALMGSPIRTSRDDRWAFISLSDTDEQFGTEEEQRARREALLDHPRILLDGCYPAERSGDQRFQWCSESGSIYVDDPAPDDGTNVLTLTVEAPAGTGTLTLSVGGEEQTIGLGPAPATTSLVLPANDRVTVQFDTTATPAETALGDRRDLRFRLVEPAIEPAP